MSNDNVQHPDWTRTPEIPERSVGMGGGDLALALDRIYARARGKVERGRPDAEIEAGIHGSLRTLTPQAIARVRELEDELRRTKRDLADLEQAVMDATEHPQEVFDAQAMQRVELVG